MISMLTFLSGSTWHTIVDDDVEAVPIYRCDYRTGQPLIRPCENHDLHMKWKPTQMENQQKQEAQSKAVPMFLNININHENMNLESFSDYIQLTFISKLTSWMLCIIGLLAWEYSIWNSAVTALQFWTADIKPHILSDAIEWIYTAFFSSNSAQQLHNLPEAILFSHFMTTLYNTFEIELVQEDEGYEGGSENINISTPLRRAPRIYHVSTMEDLSFNPTTPPTRAK